MRDIPNLSLAETERLALLAEELCEAGQVIGKILRHGYESTHPDGGPTNRQLLEDELGHVEMSVDLLRNYGDIDARRIDSAYDDKLARVGRWMHHNKINMFSAAPRKEVGNGNEE